MKKILYFLCIVLFSTTVYAASDTSNATLNNAQVRFNNGEIQTIQCYNINGYNFVRIRDIMNHLDMKNYIIGELIWYFSKSRISIPVSTRRQWSPALK